MATYGITSAGFVTKPLTTIDDEVDAGLQGILGASAGTEADGKLPTASIAGQLKALIVDGWAAMWDGLEAVVASVDPNKATDASQDALCSLTGTIRDAARFSTVQLTCVGVTGTVLLAGRVCTVDDTGARFSSTLAGDQTIAAATAWAPLTAYVVGDKRTNNGNIYRCITAGTSAGAGGPTTTSTDITDGSVHWRYLGVGTGYVVVQFTAEVVGPIGGLAGTINTISTPVNGWNAVYNEADAVVGALQETNSALRARRDAELATQGNATRDAIRANILKVNEGSTDPNHIPPTTCEVFVNDTDVTDANGVPPHAVEVLVQDGTDADIAQEVYNSVGAGTATYGNQTSSVTDSEGNTHTVHWSRPVEVPIYLTAQAYYNAAAWPASSDALVAQYILSALLTYTATWPIGLDVRTSPLNGAMMRGGAQVDTTGVAVVPAADGSAAVPGLLEIASILISTSPAPASSTSIAITSRQIATFSSSRITITATTESP